MELQYVFSSIKRGKRSSFMELQYVFSSIKRGKCSSFFSGFHVEHHQEKMNFPHILSAKKYSKCISAPGENVYM